MKALKEVKEGKRDAVWAWRDRAGKVQQRRQEDEIQLNPIDQTTILNPPASSTPQTSFLDQSSSIIDQTNS
jgi:hypothetical protein